jgi:hypothetical protein
MASATNPSESNSLAFTDAQVFVETGLAGALDRAAGNL